MTAIVSAYVYTSHTAGTLPLIIVPITVGVYTKSNRHVETYVQ